ncbi:MAG: hypothetical protein IIB44_13175 [Candidatus Marinimicrobia bacterium]|nr:hypothetical protein [Candidatus Neomarinimicrobiota bacterium]
MLREQLRKNSKKKLGKATFRIIILLYPYTVYLVTYLPDLAPSQAGKS